MDVFNEQEDEGHNDRHVISSRSMSAYSYPFTLGKNSIPSFYRVDELPWHYVLNEHEHKVQCNQMSRSMSYCRALSSQVGSFISVNKDYGTDAGDGRCWKLQFTIAGRVLANGKKCCWASRFTNANITPTITPLAFHIVIQIPALIRYSYNILVNMRSIYIVELLCIKIEIAVCGVATLIHN